MKQNRLVAIVVGLFPVLLMTGILLIPVVADYGDHQLAETAVSYTTRWVIGHILSGIAFSYSILAIFVLCQHLFPSNAKTTLIIMPFIVMGAGLLTIGMGADGIGPVAVQNAGGAPSLFFDGSSRYIPILFAGGSILFSLGQIGLMIAIQHTEQFSRTENIALMTFAILFSISSATPSGWGLYVLGTAGLVIYGIIAQRLWETV